MHEEDTVDLPVEEGARMVTLALLAACEDAAGRLEEGRDEEALHDFRVALRRLRTALRAFRPSLRSSITEKRERRLCKLANATNRSRDAEVELAWLAARRDGASPRQCHGVELLSSRIAARAPVDEGDRAEVVRRYRRLAEKMARRLRTYECTVGDGRVPFGAVLAANVAHELSGLRKRLEAIQGPADERGVHRARIAGKRLRYLLETLQGTRYAAAGESVKELKGLQDILGGIHDCHVIAATISGALVEAATQQALRVHATLQGSDLAQARARDEARAGPRAGLLELDRLARDERDALFARLEAEWRDGGIEVLAARVKGLTSSLEARAGGTLERERSYLLTAAPPAPQGSREVEVTLGWLPGERLVEHVRRERAEGKERCWRAVGAGRGESRVVPCEETTREVFEALWPFTEGRRLELRRRLFEEGRTTWIVDELADRPLVIARVAPSPQELEPDVPVWLRPLIVMEITDDPDFSCEALARTAGVPPRARPESRSVEASTT